MFARIADDENYNGVLVEGAGYTQSGREISAGRSAAEDSLHSSQQPRQIKRFAIGNVDYFVNVLDVNVRRHDLLPDSLDEIRSRFDNLSGLFVSLENRAVRIGADDSDRRVLLLQETAGAGDRAAGAEPCHEMSDLPFSLTPQLRTGSAVMSFGICAV